MISKKKKMKYGNKRFPYSIEYPVVSYWTMTLMSSILPLVTRMKMHLHVVLNCVQTHFRRQQTCLARRVHLEHVLSLKHENAMAI